MPRNYTGCYDSGHEYMDAPWDSQMHNPFGKLMGDEYGHDDHDEQGLGGEFLGAGVKMRGRGAPRTMQRRPYQAPAYYPPGAYAAAPPPPGAVMPQPAPPAERPIRLPSFTRPRSRSTPRAKPAPRARSATRAPSVGGGRTPRAGSKPRPRAQSANGRGKNKPAHHHERSMSVISGMSGKTNKSNKSNKSKGNKKQKGGMRMRREKKNLDMSWTQAAVKDINAIKGLISGLRSITKGIEVYKKENKLAEYMELLKTKLETNRKTIGQIMDRINLEWINAANPFHYQCGWQWPANLTATRFDHVLKEDADQSKKSAYELCDDLTKVLSFVMRQGRKGYIRMRNILRDYVKRYPSAGIDIRVDTVESASAKIVRAGGKIDVGGNRKLFDNLLPYYFAQHMDHIKAEAASPPSLTLQDAINYLIKYANRDWVIAMTADGKPKMSIIPTENNRQIYNASFEEAKRKSRAMRASEEHKAKRAAEATGATTRVAPAASAAAPYPAYRPFSMF